MMTMPNQYEDKELADKKLIEEIDVITDNLLANGINAKGVYDDKIYQLITQKQREARIDELDNLGYKTGQVSFHSTERRYKELQAELTKQGGKG